MNKEPQRTGRLPERWGLRGAGGGGSRREQMMKTREEFQESQDQKGFPRDNMGSILKMIIWQVGGHWRNWLKNINWVECNFQEVGT